MNEHEKLVLEGFWINPHSHVSYLDDDLFISVEFKNDFDSTIEIKTIACSFQVEPSLPKRTFSISPHISIKPNHRSPTLKIPFKIDLTLQGATNYPNLEVHYTINKKIPQTISFSNPDTRYVIIHPKHPPEKQFFISHKDPENTLLAQKLAHHLEKIGFRGYVAENDPKPGFDIWDEKILPSIEDCKGLIVLWTEDAANNPDSIYREIGHARTHGKRIVLLADKDVKIPNIFEDTIEHMANNETVTDYDLVQLVDAIHDLYTHGSF